MAEYPRKFIHKGEDCMSFKGFMLTEKTYYYHLNQKMSMDAIFLKYGAEFEDILDEQDRKIEKWHRSYPKIRNMQEHFEYILKNHVEFKEAVRLREKMEGKADEEKIRMFPVAFQWVLAIHLLQEKRMSRGMIKPRSGEVEVAQDNLLKFDDESDALDLL